MSRAGVDDARPEMLMAHCPRCQGSVLTQRFTEAYGRGVRTTCLACGETIEQIEAEPILTLAEMRAIARANADRQKGAG